MSGKFYRSRRLAGGFTLIEVLVVVGLILLLAGIFVPVARRGLTSAREAQCIANLKVWGNLTSSYAIRNQGQMPPLAGAGDPLYAAGTSLKNYFSSQKVSSRIAYSPCHEQGGAYATKELKATDTWWRAELLHYDQEILRTVDDSDILPDTPGGTAEIIVDERDSGATLSPGWTSQGPTADNYASYCVYALGAAARTVRWGFGFTGGVDRTLSCEVWVYYKYGQACGGGTWTPSAKYTIQDRDAATPVFLNQDIAKGWIRLNKGAETDTRFLFVDGQTYSVTLSDEGTPSTKYTIADAIKIIPKEVIGGGTGPTLENGFRRCQGGWQYFTGVTGWNRSSVTGVQLPASPLAIARWLFTVPETGTVSVYAFWHKFADYNTGVIYKTVYQGGQMPTTVNQAGTGDEWTCIAPSVTMNSGTQYYVEITSTVAGQGNWVMADAVKVVKNIAKRDVREIIGYLYLGYRDSLPGTVYPTPAWSMTANLTDVDSPASIPIVVDFIVDGNPGFSSHSDGGGHLLMLDGHVEYRLKDKTYVRWEDDAAGKGMRFRW